MRPILKIASVRVRLTLWNVGVLALTLLFLAVAVRCLFQAGLSANADNVLLRQARSLQFTVASAPLEILRYPDGSPFPRPRPPDPLAFHSAVMDLSGRPLLPYLTAKPWDASTVPSSQQGHSVYSTIHLTGQTLRVLSVPLTRNGRIIGVAQAVQPVTQEMQEVAHITRVLLTLTPFALLCAGIGGAFLTDRALRPVRALSSAAGRVEASRLSERLPVSGDDELAELAATFNAMLGRIEDAFTQLTEANERQRRFTADASHELRTPLTVIKANASLALLAPRTAAEYRQSLEAVDLAADRTEKIVHDLLLQARLDAGKLPLRPVSLCVLQVVETARDFSVPPGSASVTLDIPQSLAITGDADALTRLFGNLLSNAAQHTPPSGSISVSASGGQGQVTVRVQDTGTGIAPEHLPHLTERFYRADDDRSSSHGGTGLGLAISRGIVEAHGGTLHFASEPCAGTTVTVTLPATPCRDCLPHSA